MGLLLGRVGHSGWCERSPPTVIHVLDSLRPGIFGLNHGDHLRLRVQPSVKSLSATPYVELGQIFVGLDYVVRVRRFAYVMLKVHAILH